MLTQVKASKLDAGMLGTVPGKELGGAGRPSSSPRPCVSTSYRGVCLLLEIF